MKINLFLKITVIFLFMNQGYAQKITLDQFLNRLKRDHPFFKSENLTTEIEKQERDSYLGKQDWNLFSSLRFSHERPAIAFAGPERTDVLSLYGGVEKQFWETGGRISASFSTARADIKINPLFGFPASFYQNIFAVTYTHPLLKNKNGFLDKLAYELKQFDIDFSATQTLENQEDFLASAAMKFLEWVYLTEQRKILRERLHLSEEELERTKSKRMAYLVEQVDVIRAEDAVRISEQNLVLVETQWNALQAELAVLSQNDSLTGLEPDFNLYKFDSILSENDAISEIRNNSRLLKTLEHRQKQLQYSRTGFREALKPDLSIIAQLNTKNVDTGFGKSLIMDKTDAVVGLDFSVPLENRTTRSLISKTDLQIVQLQKQYENVTIALISTLTNVVRQIEQLREVLVLNVEQIESSRERTREEIKLYNQGRGDLTFVIQGRDNEQNAQLTYATNALVYNKLIISYMTLIDRFYSM